MRHVPYNSWIANPFILQKYREIVYKIVKKYFSIREGEADKQSAAGLPVGKGGGIERSIQEIIIKQADVDPVVEDVVDAWFHRNVPSAPRRLGLGAIEVAQ